MPSRFRWTIFPDPNRDFPHRWTDWWRLSAVLAVVLLLAGGLVWQQPLQRAFTCGWFDGSAWSAGDECVGLSDGSYDFGLDRFSAVLHVVEQQNAAAADKCDPQGTPVTVGVLLTLTDRNAGGRALHELEGMAAGQRHANDTGCLHPMRLVVANVGAYGPDNEAVEVARALADDPDVVAVAGLGLSRQRSAEVADLLAAAKVPMVSDLITAEGFDQTGSRDDQPDFRACDPDITYPRGIGRDYFYRVAYRNAVQIEQLAAALPGRPDFLMVPTGGSDPYPCTALPLMQRRFGGKITEVKFDADEASTVPLTAQRVCGAAKDVEVLYIARGGDLARFLFSLDEALVGGRCAAGSVTVVSTSDGLRVRSPEDNAMLEDLRLRALRSPSFTDGRIRLVSTLVSGADRFRGDNPGFRDLEMAFAGAGFDATHLDDGWAVNGYDAVTTISAALRTLPSAKPVQRSQVNTAISGFSSSGQAVAGAGGPITFDNSGNRADAGPPVVRVCPQPAPDGDRPARTPSVVVHPGTPPDC
ncbi:ABC transporter substrate-binding protein [Amycolatopsis mediterranei S699]|uniref:ABC transport system substrate-binding protein n=2 Tax=Amycolatopsis mediterranei TaxID=33910 RepID=A0A0H3D1Y9_AMYMU|nr:ABC transporter substrate-binding protein [Amycolatopsis mediterranei]ADJ44954.1 ABC transport system substrate-binding protein [Amycolatopsis mediterranei U32]AEK41705.1 ABC transporter substrate-binding protein [Amycolatopsis mediterranei S699]AFO76665.1 ABC transporter substrate-binding protein [Amycolatopsis mediterranei S699]AGT83793.1 ABC transporter substrate-binding protein [Amycolatopsis mediterranei RB]KDO07220.1 ABC transporter substrate-binding protein [Amycolatopsis mediterrane